MGDPQPEEDVAADAQGERFGRHAREAAGCLRGVRAQPDEGRVQRRPGQATSRQSLRAMAGSPWASYGGQNCLPRTRSPHAGGNSASARRARLRGGGLLAWGVRAVVGLRTHRVRYGHHGLAKRLLPSWRYHFQGTAFPRRNPAASGPGLVKPPYPSILRVARDTSRTRSRVNLHSPGP